MVTKAAPREDYRGMWLALGGYALLFAGKLAAYYFSGIGVLFAEAMHSVADMLIAGFLLLAAWYSSRPADEYYRFGRRRAQNIAALVAATIFISFTSLETLREAIPRLLSNEPAEYGNVSLAITVVAVSLVISALPLLTILRQKRRGAAMRAQLIETINDLVALGAALVGIVLVLEGFPKADPIASIVVAIVIAVNAVLLWRENARELLGRSPDKAYYEKVRETALAVPGTLDAHNLIAEVVGGQTHLSFHIGVAPGTPVEEADRITHETERAVLDMSPDTFLVIHTDPVDRPRTTPATNDVRAAEAAPDDYALVDETS